MIPFFIRQFSLMVLMTLGVAIEYICGNFDLAFAAQISASSLLSIFLVTKGVPIFISWIMIFVFNGLIGCMKGIFITKFRIPSIIVTLAFQMILVNFCAGITNGTNLTMPYLKELYKVFPMELIEIGLAAMGLTVTHYFLNYTYYGKYCYMLGENMALAEKDGLNCTAVSVLIHGVVSLFFSIPAILLAMYTGSGSGSLGMGYLYQVLAAMLLGRNMVYGKKKSVFGMFWGSFILVLFTSILTAKGHLNQWENILEGIIILVCLSREYRKKSENSPPKSENPHIEKITEQGKIKTQ